METPWGAFAYRVSGITRGVSACIREPARVGPIRRPSRGDVTPLGVPVTLPQHADQDRPKRPVLLAVDQQLGEVGSRDVACILGCRFHHGTTSLHTGWSVDAYWISSSTGTRPNSVTSTSPMLRLTTLIRGSIVCGLPAGTTLAGLPLMVIR